MEAVCFQTRDILEAMNKDCGIPLTKLHVDGKMTTNNLLMQLQVNENQLICCFCFDCNCFFFQADISGIPVVRAQSQDITALGTAIAAGCAEGVHVWNIDAEERELVPSDTFLPTSTEDGKLKMG